MTRVLELVQGVLRDDDVTDADLPKDPGATPAPNPPRWRRALDVIVEPAPAVVIEGIVWAGCVSVLVSESGAGKTFTVLSQAASVSADLPWHGRQVQQGSVVYVGYEGHVGLRLRALREVAGHWLEHIFVIQPTDPLSPTIDRDRNEIPSRGELELAGDLDDLSTALEAGHQPPIVLVIIDTVRASLAGSEDSSETIAAYLRAFRRVLAHAPAAGGLITHHAGWQDGEQRRRRERGSSALRGNVDATLYLESAAYDAERGQARLTLTTLKARDGEVSAPLHLVRRRVEIPSLIDRWGKPVTSCVIEEDRRSPEDRKAEEARVTDAEHDAVDRRTLHILASRPDLTSQERVRAAVNRERKAVYASLERLIDQGLVLPPKAQRQPYTVTAAGEAMLKEGSSCESS